MQVATTIDGDNGMVVKRLSVPIGLEELMESLTKQVLLKKPKDVYAFASEHFAHLLTLRDQKLSEDRKENGPKSKKKPQPKLLPHEKIKIKSATNITKYNKLPTPIIFTNSKSAYRTPPKTPQTQTRKSSRTSVEPSPRSLDRTSIKSSSSDTSRKNDQSKQGRVGRARWKKQDQNAKPPIPLPAGKKPQDSPTKKKLVPAVKERVRRTPSKEEKAPAPKEDKRNNSKEDKKNGSKEDKKKKLESAKRDKATPRVRTSLSKSSSVEDDISVKGSSLNLSNKSSANKKKAKVAVVTAAAAIPVATVAALTAKNIKLPPDVEFINGVNLGKIEGKISCSAKNSQDGSCDTVNKVLIKDETVDSDFVDEDDKESIASSSNSNKNEDVVAKIEDYTKQEAKSLNESIDTSNVLDTDNKQDSKLEETSTEDSQNKLHEDDNTHLQSNSNAETVIDKTDSPKHNSLEKDNAEEIDKDTSTLEKDTAIESEEKDADVKIEKQDADLVVNTGYTEDVSGASQTIAEKKEDEVKDKQGEDTVATVVDTKDELNANKEECTSMDSRGEITGDEANVEMKEDAKENSTDKVDDKGIAPTSAKTEVVAKEEDEGLDTTDAKSEVDTSAIKEEDVNMYSTDAKAEENSNNAKSENELQNEDDESKESTSAITEDHANEKMKESDEKTANETNAELKENEGLDATDANSEIEGNAKNEENVSIAPTDVANVDKKDDEALDTTDKDDETNAEKKDDETDAKSEFEANTKIEEHQSVDTSEKQEDEINEENKNDNGLDTTEAKSEDTTNEENKEDETNAEKTEDAIDAKSELEANSKIEEHESVDTSEKQEVEINEENKNDNGLDTTEAKHEDTTKEENKEDETNAEKTEDAIDAKSELEANIKIEEHESVDTSEKQVVEINEENKNDNGLDTTEAKHEDTTKEENKEDETNAEIETDPKIAGHESAEKEDETNEENKDDNGIDTTEAKSEDKTKVEKKEDDSINIINSKTGTNAEQINNETTCNTNIKTEDTTNEENKEAVSHIAVSDTTNQLEEAETNTQDKTKDDDVIIPTATVESDIIQEKQDANDEIDHSIKKRDTSNASPLNEPAILLDEDKISEIENEENECSNDSNKLEKISGGKIDNEDSQIDKTDSVIPDTNPVHTDIANKDIIGGGSNDLKEDNIDESILVNVNNKESDEVPEIIDTSENKAEKVADTSKKVGDSTETDAQKTDVNDTPAADNIQVEDVDKDAAVQNNDKNDLDGSDSKQDSKIEVIEKSIVDGVESEQILEKANLKINSETNDTDHSGTKEQNVIENPTQNNAENELVSVGTNNTVTDSTRIQVIEGNHENDDNKTQTHDVTPEIDNINEDEITKSDTTSTGVNQEDIQDKCCEDMRVIEAFGSEHDGNILDTEENQSTEKLVSGTDISTEDIKHNDSSDKEKNGDYEEKLSSGTEINKTENVDAKHVTTFSNDVSSGNEDTLGSHAKDVLRDTNDDKIEINKNANAKESKIDDEATVKEVDSEIEGEDINNKIDSEDSKISAADQKEEISREVDGKVSKDIIGEVDPKIAEENVSNITEESETIRKKRNLDDQNNDNLISNKGADEENEKSDINEDELVKNILINDSNQNEEVENAVSSPKNSQNEEVSLQLEHEMADPEGSETIKKIDNVDDQEGSEKSIRKDDNNEGEESIKEMNKDENIEGQEGVDETDKKDENIEGQDDTTKAIEMIPPEKENMASNEGDSPENSKNNTSLGDKIIAGVASAVGVITGGKITKDALKPKPDESDTKAGIDSVIPETGSNDNNSSPRINDDTKANISSLTSNFLTTEKEHYEDHRHTKIVIHSASPIAGSPQHLLHQDPSHSSILNIGGALTPNLDEPLHSPASGKSDVEDDGPLKLEDLCEYLKDQSSSSDKTVEEEDGKHDGDVSKVDTIEDKGKYVIEGNTNDANVVENNHKNSTNTLKKESDELNDENMVDDKNEGVDSKENEVNDLHEENIINNLKNEDEDKSAHSVIEDNTDDQVDSIVTEASVSNDVFGHVVKPNVPKIEELNPQHVAATKIQSLWRGHKSRKIYPRIPSTPIPESPVGGWTNDDAAKAATVIQAFMRGHLVRKQLNIVPSRHANTQSNVSNLELDPVIEEQPEEEGEENDNTTENVPAVTEGAQNDDVQSNLHTDHSELKPGVSELTTDFNELMKKIDDIVIPDHDPTENERTKRSVDPKHNNSLDMEPVLEDNADSGQKSILDTVSDKLIDLKNKFISNKDDDGELEMEPVLLTGSSAEDTNMQDVDSVNGKLNDLKNKALGSIHEEVEANCTHLKHEEVSSSNALEVQSNDSTELKQSSNAPSSEESNSKKEEHEDNSKDGNDNSSTNVEDTLHNVIQSDNNQLNNEDIKKDQHNETVEVSENEEKDKSLIDNLSERLSNLKNKISAFTTGDSLSYADHTDDKDDTLDKSTHDSINNDDKINDKDDNSSENKSADKDAISSDSSENKCEDKDDVSAERKAEDKLNVDSAEIPVDEVSSIKLLDDKDPNQTETEITKEDDSKRDISLAKKATVAVGGVLAGGAAAVTNAFQDKIKSDSGEEPSHDFRAITTSFLSLEKEHYEDHRQADTFKASSLEEMTNEHTQQDKPESPNDEDSILKQITSKMADFKNLFTSRDDDMVKENEQADNEIPKVDEEKAEVQDLDKKDNAKEANEEGEQNINTNDHIIETVAKIENEDEGNKTELEDKENAQKIENDEKNEVKDVNKIETDSKNKADEEDGSISITDTISRKMSGIKKFFKGDKSKNSSKDDDDSADDKGSKQKTGKSASFLDESEPFNALDPDESETIEQTDNANESSIENKSIIDTISDKLNKIKDNIVGVQGEKDTKIDQENNSNNASKRNSQSSVKSFEDFVVGSGEHQNKDASLVKALDADHLKKALENDKVEGTGDENIASKAESISEMQTKVTSEENVPDAIVINKEDTKDQVESRGEISDGNDINDEENVNKETNENKFNIDISDKDEKLINSEKTYTIPGKELNQQDNTYTVENKITKNEDDTERDVSDESLNLTYNIDDSNKHARKKRSLEFEESNDNDEAAAIPDEINRNENNVDDDEQSKESGHNLLVISTTEENENNDVEETRLENGENEQNALNVEHDENKAKNINATVSENEQKEEDKLSDLHNVANVGTDHVSEENEAEVHAAKQSLEKEDENEAMKGIHVCAILAPDEKEIDNNAAIKEQSMKSANENMKNENQEKASEEGVFISEIPLNSEVKESPKSLDNEHSEQSTIYKTYSEETAAKIIQNYFKTLVLKNKNKLLSSESKDKQAKDNAARKIQNLFRQFIANNKTKLEIKHEDKIENVHTDCKDVIVENSEGAVQVDNSVIHTEMEDNLEIEKTNEQLKKDKAVEEFPQIDGVKTDETEKVLEAPENCINEEKLHSNHIDNVEQLVNKESDEKLQDKDNQEVDDKYKLNDKVEDSSRELEDAELTGINKSLNEDEMVKNFSQNDRMEESKQSDNILDHTHGEENDRSQQDDIDDKHENKTNSAESSLSLKNNQKEDKPMKISEDEAARKIQSLFREHIRKHRQKLLKIDQDERKKADEAAVKIQKLFLAFLEKQKKKGNDNQIADKAFDSANDNNEHSTQDNETKLEENELNQEKHHELCNEKGNSNELSQEKAAIKIQSLFRGILTRNKEKKKMLAGTDTNKEIADSNDDSNIRNEAALKIQRVFTEYLKTRALLKENISKTNAEKLLLNKETSTVSKDVDLKSEAICETNFLNLNLNTKDIQDEEAKLNNTDLSNKDTALDNETKYIEEKAAVKIQSAFRGYLSRNKDLDAKNKNEDSAISDVEDSEDTHELLDQIKSSLTNMKNLIERKTHDSEDEEDDTIDDRTIQNEENDDYLEELPSIDEEHDDMQRNSTGAVNIAAQGLDAFKGDVNECNTENVNKHIEDGTVSQIGSHYTNKEGETEKQDHLQNKEAENTLNGNDKDEEHVSQIKSVNNDSKTIDNVTKMENQPDIALKHMGDDHYNFSLNDHVLDDDHISVSRLTSVEDPHRVDHDTISLDRLTSVGSTTSLDSAVTVLVTDGLDKLSKQNTKEESDDDTSKNNSENPVTKIESVNEDSIKRNEGFSKPFSKSDLNISVSDTKAVPDVNCEEIKDNEQHKDKELATEKTSLHNDNVEEILNEKSDTKVVPSDNEKLVKVINNATTAEKDTQNDEIVAVNNFASKVEDIPTSEPVNDIAINGEDAHINKIEKVPTDDKSNHIHVIDTKQIDNEDEVTNSNTINPEKPSDKIITMSSVQSVDEPEIIPRKVSHCYKDDLKLSDDLKQTLDAVGAATKIQRVYREYKDRKLNVHNPNQQNDTENSKANNFDEILKGGDNVNTKSNTNDSEVLSENIIGSLNAVKVDDFKGIEERDVEINKDDTNKEQNKVESVSNVEDTPKRPIDEVSNNNKNDKIEENTSIAEKQDILDPLPDVKSINNLQKDDSSNVQKEDKNESVDDIVKYVAENEDPDEKLNNSENNDNILEGKQFVEKTEDVAENEDISYPQNKFNNPENNDTVLDGEQFVAKLEPQENINRVQVEDNTKSDETFDENKGHLDIIQSDDRRNKQGYNEAALKIQALFKEILSRKKIEAENTAALKIQRLFKAFLEKNKFQLNNNNDDGLNRYETEASTANDDENTMHDKGTENHGDENGTEINNLNNIHDESNNINGNGSNSTENKEETPQSNVLTMQEKSNIEHKENDGFDHKKSEHTVDVKHDIKESPLVEIGNVIQSNNEAIKTEEEDNNRVIQELGLRSRSADVEPVLYPLESRSNSIDVQNREDGNVDLKNAVVENRNNVNDLVTQEQVKNESLGSATKEVNKDIGENQHDNRNGEDFKMQGGNSNYEENNSEKQNVDNESPGIALLNQTILNHSQSSDESQTPMKRKTSPRPKLGDFIRSLAESPKLSNDMHKLKAKSEEIENTVKSSITELENITKEIEDTNNSSRQVQKTGADIPQTSEPFYLHDPNSSNENPIAAAIRVSSRATNQRPSLGLLHSGEFHDTIPLSFTPSNINVVVHDQRSNSRGSGTPTSPILMHSGEMHDGGIFPQGMDAPGQVFVIIQVLRQ